jgi:fructokinase
VKPQVISIGEVLFDVFGDVELLAGAPLNATTHIHRLGYEVGFVSGIGTDAAGDRAMRGIEALGLLTRWIVRVPGFTGRVQVEVSAGEPAYNILRGVAYEEIVLSNAAVCELAMASPAWVYFGTLAQSFTTTRNTTRELFASLPGARRFYDLNLRSGFDSPELVLSLLEEAHVAKLNHVELQRMLPICGWKSGSEEDICRRLADRFELEAVCVTRGEQGAGFLYRDRYVEATAPRIEVVDTVGAGDAFAAALLYGLSEQWEPERTLRFGNALGSFVASRRGAIPEMTSEYLTKLMKA